MRLDKLKKYSTATDINLVEAALATGFLTRWMPAYHLALPNRDQ